MKKEIYITGGCGYVGSRVAKKMALKGWSVVVVDQATPEERGVIFPKEVRFEHIFIAPQNYEVLKEIFTGVKIVLHLAADIGPITYMEEKQATILQHNMLTDSALYQALVEVGAEIVVYGSSSMVYQHSPRYPYTEEDMMGINPPKNIYGFSKLSGEYFCRAYKEQFQLSYIIMRYHNIYGPGEDSKGSNMGDIHVIPALLEKVTKGQYPLEFLGNPQATRSFTYVDDAVDITIKIVEKAFEKDKKILNNDFNIGNNEFISILELGEKIWKMFGDDRPFEYLVKESEGSKNSSFRREVNISKVKAFLNWSPEVSLGQGLKNTMEWVNKKYD